MTFPLMFCVKDCSALPAAALAEGERQQIFFLRHNTASKKIFLDPVGEFG